MRVFGFCMLFVVVGTSAMFLAFNSSSFSDLLFPADGEIAQARVTTRKLKENSYDVSSAKKKKKNLVNFNDEDYHIIDPAPSSKASIKSGPIEHGSPLMPYMPNPTPPSQPRHGGGSP